jgi:hypothetical protein
MLPVILFLLTMSATLWYQPAGGTSVAFDFLCGYGSEIFIRTIRRESEDEPGYVIWMDWSLHDGEFIWPRVLPLGNVC